MPKSRIDLTIDEDLHFWVRTEFEKGQLSQEVNDYLRNRLDSQLKSPQKEEKREILEILTELKQQSIAINKQVMKQSIKLQQIEVIEREDKKKRLKELDDLDKFGDALRNSDYLNRALTNMGR